MAALGEPMAGAGLNTLATAEVVGRAGIEPATKAL